MKHKGNEIMERLSNWKTKDKMSVGKPHISIVTSNVNKLNTPKKAQGSKLYLEMKHNHILHSRDTSQLQGQI